MDPGDESYTKIQKSELDARLAIPRRWKLLRRDDNGHLFEISRFSGRSEALKKLAEFEKAST